MLAEKLSLLILEQLKRENILGLTAPIAGVSDGVLNGHKNMGSSLHSRNEMSGQVAYSSDQYRPDGHIGLFACDKTGPAEAMAYTALKYDENAPRGTVPAVMMYA
jgi:dihydroxyacid dehydratase/phosphogluconate dehydratase